MSSPPPSDAEARRTRKAAAVGGLLGLLVVAAVCHVLGAGWFSFIPLLVGAVVLLLLYTGRLGRLDDRR